MPSLFAGTPHHLGCAVRSVEDSIRTYAGTLRLTRHTHPIEVRSQRVRVSFLELTEGFYLELVMPLSPDAKLATYMRVGFYHLCFLVDDLEKAATALRARQFSALGTFESEAFAGARCQFFISPELHLVELACMSREQFLAHFTANSAGKPA